MKTEIFAELKGNGTAQPVFEGLQVQAELRETLAITTITQSYRNTGTNNIEAVYTFPLPLDAVLLEMVVTLGEKNLKGTVLPKQEAEQKYEEAITDGDAPVMLQNPQPGVYVMNVGNLLPGENAKIMFRYGIFHNWQGDLFRYHLPTTIAPRFGLPDRAGFQPHQVPKTSLHVDNHFSFEMRILGDMAERIIESPSHKIAIDHTSEGKESIVSLARKSAFMDRDLVITVKKCQQEAASAIVERDGDEYLIWGSFQTQFDLADDSTPRSIKIVVDCSGSMSGDAIKQTRQALLLVLDEVRQQDWFNIVVFGDLPTALFTAQTKANSESISYAKNFLKKLRADLGGTKIGDALEMTVGLHCPEQIQQDVLLITDGEIWEWEKVIARFSKSGHRFFTVGVGSAVSEAFVRTLANRTGGACELVSPNENMPERIHRHFKRIGTPLSKSNKVVWPVQPLRVFPEELPSIFDGDTCNFFAWFTEPPVGAVQLQLSLPDSSKRVLLAPVEQAVTEKDQDGIIPRMAAAQRLREIHNKRTAQILAVKYQLISSWTHYLAIVVRNEDEKADTLPELQKVEQMLAAGWGGFGNVTSGRNSLSLGLVSPIFPCAGANLHGHKNYALMRSHCSPQGLGIGYTDYQKPDEPTFFQKSCNFAKASIENFRPKAPPAVLPVDGWIWEYGYEHLMNRFIIMLDKKLNLGSIAAIIEIPLLPSGIATALSQLVVQGIDERIVVAHFLYHLSESSVGNNLSRQAKRVIGKAYKKLHIDSQVAETIRTRLRI